MNPEIWPYYRGLYKVYTEDYEIVKKLSSWKDCRHSNTYYRNEKVIGWDFIFPSKLYNKVARLVGLPLREEKIPTEKDKAKLWQIKTGNINLRGDFTQYKIWNLPVAKRFLINPYQTINPKERRR